MLIILNVYVNYFLLRTAAKLTHSPLKTWRCIAASFYGRLFSLLILAPRLPAPVTVAVKLAAAVTIVIAAFGVRSPARTAKNSAAFFSANFILAGAVYAVNSWFKPRSVHFANSYFYIDFSLLILIITTALLYFAVRLVRIIWDRSPDGTFSVVIRCRHKVLKLEGLADTGNGLVDYFTGSPVIICPEESFTELTGVRFDITALPKGFRLLPCSAVSGRGLLPVCRCDEVMIYCAESGERKVVEAVIGFGECGKAVFNPKLLKI